VPIFFGTQVFQLDPVEEVPGEGGHPQTVD
jgi:hypothetical protein